MSNGINKQENTVQSKCSKNDLSSNIECPIDMTSNYRCSDTCTGDCVICYVKPSLFSTHLARPSMHWCDLLNWLQRSFRLILDLMVNRIGEHSSPITRHDLARKNLNFVQSSMTHRDRNAVSYFSASSRLRLQLLCTWLFAYYESDESYWDTRSGMNWSRTAERRIQQRSCSSLEDQWMLNVCCLNFSMDEMIPSAVSID